MKKLFNIEIKEIMQDTFEIEAENSAEAEYLAEKGYYDAEYILDNIEAEHRKITFIDKEGPRYISDERKEKIFNELIDYVSEHTVDEKDYYNTLKNIIGLTDNEITELGIDVIRQVDITETLKEEEIVFEDEVMIENDGSLNAYIPLYYIDVFKKFNINENEGVEYNLYLNYYNDTNKSIISIIEKNEKGDIEYQYETTDIENNMLKEKLNKYCIETSGQTIEEYLEEEEVL